MKKSKKIYKFLAQTDYDEREVSTSMGEAYQLKVVLPKNVDICVWRRVRVTIEEI